MTSRSSFTHSTNLYAPLPIGLPRQLLDARLGREPRGQDLRAHLGHAHGQSGSGFLVTMRIVRGSTTCTASIVAKPGLHDRLAGDHLRSSVALTSSAVSGAPSWNFTPGRSVNSHVVSFTLFHDVASPGWSLSAVSQRVSVS